MALAYGLVRVTFQGKSGLPTDRYTNDFSVYTEGPLDSSMATALAADLHDLFYVNNITSGVNLVNWYLSNVIDRTVDATVDLYDVTTHLDGSPHGSPIGSDAFALPDLAHTAIYIPSEVCAVISMHADETGVLEESGATRPAARRRGRLYIGPLDDGALTFASSRVELGSTFITTLAGAASALLNAWDGSPSTDFQWAVWSRADATMRPVVGGFVDNAFDTQRRRGDVPTARTAWS